MREIDGAGTEPEVSVNVHRKPDLARTSDRWNLVREYHRTQPDYSLTPVVVLEQLARDWNLGSIVLKDEAKRLGLGPLKPLGSSWAVLQHAKTVLGLPKDMPVSFDHLRSLARPRGATLCSASKGSFGRGIAIVAEALGLGCVVYAPADAQQHWIDAMIMHGASVELVAGSYEDAVMRAKDACVSKGHWYCPEILNENSDSEELAFAECAIEGYGTIFTEALDQLADTPPDVWFIQANSGALCAAGVLTLRRLSPSARIVSVELRGRNLIQLSTEFGYPANLDGGEDAAHGKGVSAVAWPILRRGLDAAVSITDGAIHDTMKVLADNGILTGKMGAMGLAGLLKSAGNSGIRDVLDLNRDTTAAVINTEGAENHEAYHGSFG